MTDTSGTHAVPHPATPAGRGAFIVTPFARLARTHAGSTMADAMVAAALAGSLFFSMPAGEARTPVLRYLIITMLPFAVISPLIGPLIDRMRGGHRFMVMASLVLRTVICYLLIGQITGESIVFFLEALILLVCQKAYQVARSALVPTVVRGDAELVEANSKLSLISGISGFVGVIPAGILLSLFGAQWSVGLAMITYAVAFVLALRIPTARVATESADETERHELRGAGIIMAGSAMGLIRAMVGFLTLLIAFDFRGGDRATWEFGFVGAVAVLSQLSGAVVAPRLRSITSEENILTGVLALVVAGGLLSLIVDDVLGAAILGGCVGFAAGGGKLAFDSILQRDAPDANRGRAFARFETRFQVTWVLGALLAVAVEMSARMGFVIVFALAAVALTSYVVGRLAYAHRTGAHQSAATAKAVEIEERFGQVSDEVKGRLARAPRQAYRRLRTGRAVHLDAEGEAVAYSAYETEEQLVYDQWGRVVPASQAHPEGVPPTAPVDGAGYPWEPPGPDPDPGFDEVDDDGFDRYDDGSHDHPATEDLAAGSSVAWRPPDDAYPWAPPPDDEEAPDAFVDDVDPSVHHPYPWSPDDTDR